MKKIFHIYFIWSAFFLIFGSNIYAELPKVIWATEIWPTATDDNGIYTKLIQEIFKGKYTLEKQEMPFKRSLRQIETNQAHLAGAITPEMKTPTMILAKYPIASPTISLLYLEDTGFDENEFVKKKFSATPGILSGYKDKISEENIKTIANRIQALKMALSGRVEYYADISIQMKNILNTEEAKNLLKGKKYKIKQINGVFAYMVAPNTEEGKKIMDVFDAGFLALYKSGELEKIYQPMLGIYPTEESMNK